MDPIPIAVSAIAGFLYWGGSRRPAIRAVGGRRRREREWRTASFAGGLLCVVAALEPPVDDLSARFFWAHMLQHLLLMTAAAPLLVLGAPWLPCWRAFSLGFRRRVARSLARGAWAAPLRASAHVLARPLTAWVLLNGDMALWHVPRLYDLTLRNDAVHYLEHLTFLTFGMLFWAQLVESPPLRPRLDSFRRVLLATAAGAAGWILAVVLALAPSPLYAYASRHGGISALADQQLAAGMMWGPGSIAYTIFVFCGLYRWLGESEDAQRPRRRARPLQAS